MTFSKVTVLVASVFLFFCVLTPMASASREMLRFSVKIYVNPWDSVMLSQHGMGRIRTLEYIQWGNITEEGGNVWTPRIGRLTWHVLMFSDLETMLGWAHVSFVMEFDSGVYAGKRIEGTGRGDLRLLPTGGGQVISGNFVGHGDMHIQGDIGPIEVGSGCKFVGYSW